VIECVRDDVRDFEHSGVIGCAAAPELREIRLVPHFPNRDPASVRPVLRLCQQSAGHIALYGAKDERRKRIIRVDEFAFVGQIGIVVEDRLEQVHNRLAVTMKGGDPKQNHVGIQPGVQIGLDHRVVALPIEIAVTGFDSIPVHRPPIPARAEFQCALIAFRAGGNIAAADMVDPQSL